MQLNEKRQPKSIQVNPTAPNSRIDKGKRIDTFLFQKQPCR